MEAGARGDPGILHMRADRLATGWLRGHAPTTDDGVIGLLRDNAPFSILATAVLKKSDFDFELPHELIAQAPLPERSASRMLLLDVAAQSRQDRMFRELPEMLRPGDLLVFNDTRVLPARLYGRKESGGAVEILIERVTGAHEATVQLGVSKKPKEGGRIELADGSHAVVLGRDEGFFRWRFEALSSPAYCRGCGTTGATGWAGRAAPQAASSGLGVTGFSSEPALAAAVFRRSSASGLCRRGS